jgi:ribosomal protein S18 acetylase RimI-like enzyme
MQRKIVSLTEVSELSPTSDQRGALAIRPARADEWSRWRETRLRMLRDDADFFSTRYDDMVREPDKTWRDWVGEAAVGEQKTLFVADEDDRWLGVVGAFVRVDPREVQLISMWVDPQARGRGIAQDLIRAVAGWAHERGSTRVVLFVQEANEPAQQLYERAGFSQTGDRAPAPGAAGRSAFKLVLAAPVTRLLAT